MKRLTAILLVICIIFVGTITGYSEKKEVEIFNSWNEVVEIDSVARTTTSSRNTTLQIYNSNTGKYAYVGFANGNGTSSEALVVYDVTDPTNIVEVTRYTDIVTRIMNAQFAIVDNYLFVSSRQSNGNNKLLMYTINADGTLSSTATEICDGGSGVDSVYICGDYLFYALAGTTGKHMKVFDISDISAGVELKGTTTADYGVVAAEIEQISDTKYNLYYITRNQTAGYQVCLNEMAINGGNILFEEKFHGITGFENVSNLSSIKDIQLIDNRKVLMVFNTAGGNGKYAQYILDASGNTPSVSEFGEARAVSIVNVSEDIYAIGDQGGKMRFYSKTDDSQLHLITNSFCGQIYDIKVDQGYLYLCCENCFVIYSLSSKVSMDVASIPEINDGIFNITANIEAKSTDIITLDILGETIDVTGNVTNGVLTYSKNINCDDGNYTAKLSIKRVTETLLFDEITFAVRKTMPIEITNSSLETGITSVTGTVKNTHNQTTNAATAYLVVYNSDGSMSKAYPDTISALEKNETDSINFTLDTAVTDGQVVKLFVVDNNGKVISDIVETAAQNFNAVTDKIPAIIADSVNLYADVNPDTVVAQISGKSSEETENIVFVAVYKPAPNNTQFDYINAFKSLNNGGFYCSYPLVGGVEGENYTVKVYATSNEVLYGEKQFSYISQATIDSALTAIYNATAETFESVAISEISPYKSIFNLNTSIYNTLIDTESNKYKIAVGEEVAGTLYTDIAALNTAFDNAVNEQKAIMDADNAQKSALADINASSVTDLPGKIEGALSVEGYAPVLGLNVTGLYTKLDSTMKPNLYTNWIYNKNFTQKTGIQTAFRDGMAIEYLKFAQFSSIVENNIIETYYAELGLNYTDVQTYSTLSEQNKKDAVAYFLDLDLTNYSLLGSKFNEALDDYDDNNSNGNNTNNTTTITGGGDGGSGITIKPVTEIPPEIKEEDLIPEEVLAIEKKNIFKDVKVDDWYFEAVCLLNEKKIVEGITVDEFKPDQNVKREEFAKMIVSAFNLVDYGAKSTFNDVESNRWYYAYVATAQKLQLINGIGDNKFGIGQDMTRQDLAKLVYDTMKALGKPIETTEKANFFDMDSVSDYANEAVNALYSAKIMNGFEDNTFRPQGTVTRAMAAQVIYGIVSKN